MKIEDKRKGKLINEMDLGECFEYGDLIFMRTVGYKAINLSSGLLYESDYFEKILLTPINAKVVIEE